MLKPKKVNMSYGREENGVAVTTRVSTEDGRNRGSAFESYRKSAQSSSLPPGGRQRPVSTDSALWVVLVILLGKGRGWGRREEWKTETDSQTDWQTQTGGEHGAPFCPVGWRQRPVSTDSALWVVCIILLGKERGGGGGGGGETQTNRQTDRSSK